MCKEAPNCLLSQLNVEMRFSYDLIATDLHYFKEWKIAIYTSKHDNRDNE